MAKHTRNMPILLLQNEIVSEEWSCQNEVGGMIEAHTCWGGGGGGGGEGGGGGGGGCIL